ncbi:MAG: rod shape-determining protein MreD [Anaerotignaceae bacterium]
MRRSVTIFAVLVINLVLQSTLMNSIQIRGIIPNTAIIVIVSMSLLRGSTEGAITGVIAGLLQDIFFGIAFGYYTFWGMLLGFWVGKINKGFYRENYVIPIFICSISTVAYESCIYLTGMLFSGNTDYLYFLINLIIPEMVYNAILTILIYRVLFSINSILEQKEKYKRKLFSIK